MRGIVECSVCRVGLECFSVDKERARATVQGSRHTELRHDIMLGVEGNLKAKKWRVASKGSRESHLQVGKLQQHVVNLLQLVAVQVQPCQLLWRLQNVRDKVRQSFQCFQAVAGEAHGHGV